MKINTITLYHHSPVISTCKSDQMPAKNKKDIQEIITQAQKLKFPFFLASLNIASSVTGYVDNKGKPCDEPFIFNAEK